MKTIGLIGGMSWESTVTYYQILNEKVKQALEGLHSAKCILYSVDFAQVEQHQASGQWDQSARLLAEAAQSLERAGADFIVICSNTMHKLAPQIQAAVRIPLLHIAEATADELIRHRIRKVGLLGTQYTMTQDFYKGKLMEKGLAVVIPEPADVEIVNRVIYQELCLGVLSEPSQKAYLRIIEALTEQGAEGVILGCTEIGLLVKQADTPIPLFDTTAIHAAKAAEYALSGAFLKSSSSSKPNGAHSVFSCAVRVTVAMRDSDQPRSLNGSAHAFVANTAIHPLACLKRTTF